MRRLDIICVRNCLNVGRIVVAVLKHLLVRSYHLRLLLSELTLKILEYVFHRTVVDITSHTEGEHVLALVDSLLVQTAVLQALFSECRYRCDDDSPVLDIEFRDRIALESGSFKTVLIEGVGIDQNHSCPLQPFGIGLEGCGVHGNEKIAEVTRSGDMLAADVYLETGHT